jgi:hypothetical protein
MSFTVLILLCFKYSNDDPACHSLLFLLYDNLKMFSPPLRRGHRLRTGDMDPPPDPPLRSHQKDGRLHLVHRLPPRLRPRVRP